MHQPASHLKHLLLRPGSVHRRGATPALELRHLFRPAWHPLCTTGDLAKPGDFLTFDLMETPILLRNFDGELRAFLNVCPHRHSRLTDKAQGHAEVLRCQYHGWEYNKDGHTGKIPEAKAFRPWDRENSCLKQFRLETCGEMVFVNFSDTRAVTPWSGFGPLFDRWAPYLGGAYQHALTWEADFACNWKVVVENSLESYHIPLIHPKTFGVMPTEENSWHELEPTFTTYKTMVASNWVGRRQAWTVRMLGEHAKLEYWHYNQHPHITVSTLDVHRLVMCGKMFPLERRPPARCTGARCSRPSRRAEKAWNPLDVGSLSRFLRPIVIHVAKKIFTEDGGLYPAIQHGLEASPHRGVIGTREERIYHFQEFVENGLPRRRRRTAAGG